MWRVDAPLQEGLRQPFPRTVAASLERQFGKLNDIAMEIVRRELVPAMRSGKQAAINAALSAVQRAINAAYGDDVVQAESEKVAEQINANHSKRFFAAIGTALGMTVLGNDDPKRGAGGRGGMPPTPGFKGFEPPKPSGKAILGVKVNVAPSVFADDFAANNVMLIGDLRKGIRKGLADAIVRAKMEGLPPEEMTRRLLLMWEKNGIPAQLPTARMTKEGTPVMISTQKHAKLVAHDQVSKLNAQLNQTRQQAAGIEKFKWVTMGDLRVRPKHQALNGRIFSWEDPETGGEGLPGEPIHCRCHAEAVIDRGQILSRGNFVPL